MHSGSQPVVGSTSLWPGSGQLKHSIWAECQFYLSVPYIKLAIIFTGEDNFDVQWLLPPTICEIERICIMCSEDGQQLSISEWVDVLPNITTTGQLYIIQAFLKHAFTQVSAFVKGSFSYYQITYNAYQVHICSLDPAATIAFDFPSD